MTFEDFDRYVSVGICVYSFLVIVLVTGFGIAGYRAIRASEKQEHCQESGES